MISTTTIITLSSPAKTKNMVKVTAVFTMDFGIFSLPMLPGKEI
jgi:hypothetical protein